MSAFPGIVVVGCGAVGEGTAQVLETTLRIEVGRHDPPQGDDLSAVSGPRVRDVLFCLPTPGATDTTPAALDTSLVEAALREWAERCTTARLVVRSTVPPDFWERLPWSLRARCVHWPCFAEHWRLEEFETHPPFVVVGGDSEGNQGLRREFIAAMWGVKEWEIIPSNRKLPVFLGCSLLCASWIKLSTNALYAANIVLANELAALGASYGVEWDEVRKALDANPSLGDTFAVSPAGGYGGACLTKDVGHVVGLAKERFHGWPLRLLPVLSNANEQAKLHRSEALHHAG